MVYAPMCVMGNSFVGLHAYRRHILLLDMNGRGRSGGGAAAFAAARTGPAARARRGVVRVGGFIGAVDIDDSPAAALCAEAGGYFVPATVELDGLAEIDGQGLGLWVEGLEFFALGVGGGERLLVRGAGGIECSEQPAI